MDKFLKQFRVIADQKSLGAAARVLYISQSALTKNMKKLEQRYDAPLFQRHSRGVELTEFGKVLYERCINIEREYTYAEREIDILRNSKTKHLVIGLGIGYSVIISPVLERLINRFPDIKISLVSGSLSTLISSVVAGDIDLVLGGHHNININDFGMTHQPIFDTEHSLVVRKKHPLATKQGIELADLQPYPWIQFQYSDDQSRQIHNFLSNNGQPPANIVLQSNFLRTAHAVLKTGDYIMNIPTPAISEIVHDVAVLNVSFVFLPFTSGAYFFPDTAKMPYIRIIVDGLHGEIQKNNP